ncbi:DUF4179 domain-containing protein [Oceanobacillus jordanicus]|uniref:DUF4179 domain-containing protein n=1 Tax=Oceanobacillus jordanicus TaxID=2867266 RepID=A0AAW5AVU4_9BACI|nr:DUF4179 domain-containing protein [Oceanobacillus jordanicus]MCG3417670.1 DUF4179 domain-containing protein [Oceanobacillus jordanicus]
MNKKHFQTEMENIDFPKMEADTAIDKGIQRARDQKGKERKKKYKLISTVSSTAAASFLAAGLVFAPVSNVLAAVPVIGSIYEKYGLNIGENLWKGNLVTEINESTSNKGVDITISNAYYDGNVIGVAFKANGKALSLDNLGENKGPEIGYSYHLFNGDEQNQWSSGATGITETEEGYVGTMEFYNPKADLSDIESLPLTFTSILGKEGNWQFDVPIEQIPAVESDVEGQVVWGGYTLELEKLVKGKATTMLSYRTTLPASGKHDNIQLTVTDNLGNRLFKHHADTISAEENGDSVMKNIRELFGSKVEGDASKLIIQPEIRQYEQETTASIDQTLPFEIESERFSYFIRVTNTQVKDGQLVVDYALVNVDDQKLSQDIIDNFANYIMLIETDDIQTGESGETDPNQMINHQIRSVKTELINNESLQFQSSFPVDAALTMSDYSLIVPFGTLSSNQPIKMDPLEINLEERE